LRHEGQRRAAVDVIGEISDDEFPRQRRGQPAPDSEERGTTLICFQPRASGMATISATRRQFDWSQLSNDCIHRVCTLFRRIHRRMSVAARAGVRRNPASPNSNAASTNSGLWMQSQPRSIGGELDRAAADDRSWYPLYEKLCELSGAGDGACQHVVQPEFHTTGAHYINADHRVHAVHPG